MSLTVVQVEEIHRLHAGAVRARQIGEIVGVSIRTVNEVLEGRRTGRPLTPREQAELDAQQGWRAACMDDLEWAEWIARNNLAVPDQDAAARPCTDCPLGFAADMRAQGRCNGTPGGVAEEIDQEEEPMVAAPVIEAPPTVPVAKPAKPSRPAKVDVPDPGLLARARAISERRFATIDVPTLEVPCGTCLHQPVCALKTKIPSPGGDGLPVELGPGLRQRIAGFRVECDHHLDVARLVPAGKPHLASPQPDRNRGGRADEREREERAARVVAAIARHGGDQRAAAAELGMKLNALVMVVKWAGRSATAKEDIA